MSHNVSDSQETTSSGYRTQEELETGAGVSMSRKLGEMSDREKLKEELLRQYEAGQLKSSISSGPTILSGTTNHPRQIPTIEEYRQTSVHFRRPVASVASVALSRPVSTQIPASLHFPDISRPPPGYSYSSQPSLQLLQPQSISAANYEVSLEVL